MKINMAKNTRRNTPTITKKVRHSRMLLIIVTRRNLQVSDDYVDSTTFMGGVKKNVLSKKFKGAEKLQMCLAVRRSQSITSRYGKHSHLELTECIWRNSINYSRTLGNTL
jgi:hypothetical protein